MCSIGDLRPRVVWFLLLGAFVAVADLPRARAEQPVNFVTVFIDDMGWSDLSCFGGLPVETSHIDRLADEGIRFTNFYVNSPICSPSRVALTTGQYPQRWRISSYLASRRLNEERGMAQWLDPTAPCLPRQLNGAGFATGHFGKWHMGGQRDVGDAPLISAYGFDHSLTNFEGLGPRVLPLKDAYDGTPPGRHDLGSADLGRGPIRWEDRSVITAAFVDEALDFIDDAQAAEKPFFVNVWPDDVHSPFFPPESLRDLTDGSKRSLYYAVLQAMDDQLGKLFDRIRNDPQLRDRTLIFVMSDNGPEPGAGSCDPLRGAKTLLYEGGVRSPLIVWGPGLLAPDTAGTTNETSVLSAIDLNRSIYDLANVAVPEEFDLDGENLADTLLGKEQSSRQAPLFWRRPPDRPGTAQAPNPDLAVRDGRWKFYLDYDGTGAQLYDLAADAGETENIAGEHEDVVKRLTRAISQWNEDLPADAGFAQEAEPDPSASLPADQFVNPIAEGADPWVVRDPANDRYLWCFSEGNEAIAIHESDRLTSLGEKHIVWTAPDKGPVSAQIWAPELHFLDDHWHIYFAASDGDNANHLAYVLRSATADPFGEYELHGPFATGDGKDGKSPNVWAIDMTVLELNGQRYAIWSGWDAPGTDRQYLYIAPMKSPLELAAPRVRLSDNDDYLWERTEPNESSRGLNEGPQVFQSKGRTCVVYSCGASWLPTYKLGLLELKPDADPLDPKSWIKRPQPVFESTDQTYGVGHSCFVLSPDGQQWWHVFHAKRDREPGWRRVLFAQPMRVGRRGFPLLGSPTAAGPMSRPSGEASTESPLPLQVPLDSGASLGDWSYFGHHQFVHLGDDGLHLGRHPESPINSYRSGEKIVFDRPLPDDLTARVTIDFRADDSARDAGLLFRCTGPSVGYDAQRGYFAGLIPKTGLAILGKTDGRRWQELARADVNIEPSTPHVLEIEVSGDEIVVRVDQTPVIRTTDSDYRSGGLGLRVVDTHAVFSDLQIED